MVSVQITVAYAATERRQGWGSLGWSCIITPTLPRRIWRNISVVTRVHEKRRLLLGNMSKYSKSWDQQKDKKKIPMMLRQRGL